MYRLSKSVYWWKHSMSPKKVPRNHKYMHAFAGTSHTVAVPPGFAWVPIPDIVIYYKPHLNLFRGFEATGGRYSSFPSF